MPPEQGRLLVVISPWVVHRPSQENLQKVLPQGENP